MSTTNRIIAVTGATGQQGGAVAKHLLRAGWKVRALTRDANKPAARALAAAGAEVVPGDMDNRAELDAAFKGVYGVFSLQNFWLPNVGAEGEVRQGKQVADAAKAAGVQHFIYSSVGASYRGLGQAHFATKWEIEQYVQALGLPATILRPVAFMDNYGAFSRALILNGIFPSWGLRPDKALQIIAVEDIGAFAALALANPQDFIGKTLEIAGDELTESQIVATLSRVIGRPVALQAPSMPEGKTPDPEQLAMFNFFNQQGYEADIPALRKLHPALLTFEQYLRRSGWENAEPVPLPTGPASWG